MTDDETLAGIADALDAVAGVNRSAVTPQTTFAELGLDSMATLEAIVAIEDRFGMLIADDDWSLFQTIGDAVRYIERVADPLPSSGR
jgi:acyl carrier protein